MQKWLFTCWHVTQQIFAQLTKWILRRFSEWKNQRSHRSKCTLSHIILTGKRYWIRKVNLLEYMKKTLTDWKYAAHFPQCMMPFDQYYFWYPAMLTQKAVSLSMLSVICVSLHVATSPQLSLLFINLCGISHPTVTTQRTRRMRLKRNPVVRTFIACNFAFWVGWSQ